VPLQQLPASFPNERSRNRILTVLSIANLTSQRRETSLTWVQVSPLAPDFFRSPPALPEAGKDDLEHMRRAQPVEQRESLMPPES
jgi:hypothetical protein